MTQRVGLLNGTNITYDKDLTAGILAILNQWVIEGLGISWSWASANVLPWKALIECIRTNGEKVMVFFENTANVVMDLTGTKKLYILVDQAKIDDGSSNALDGTGIGSIQTGASYPSWDYIPLASVTGGVITDARVYISWKDIKRKWMGASFQAIEIDSSGNEVAKPISWGTAIADTDTLRKRKVDWTYEDVPFSVIKNVLSGMVSEYPTVHNLLANDFATYTAISATWSSTTKIGATTAQTSFPALSTGVTSDKVSVVLNKVWSPWNLVLRVETDNGSWSPSWTLVDPNATQTISNLAIYAMTYNYTFTFPSSISFGAGWTPIHFVFKVWAGVIDWANNYDISVNWDFPAIYSISAWSGTDLTATRWMTINTLPSGAYDLYNDFTVSTECMLKSFYIYWSFTGATRVKVIKLSAIGGTEQITLYDQSFASTTLSNSFYTLISLLQLKPWDYRIRVIGNGTYSTISAPTSVVNSAHITWQSIQTLSVTQIVTQAVVYTLLSTIKNIFLSKSKADKSQNADVYAGITEPKTAWGFPKIIKMWYMVWFSNLIKGTTYYLSNTGVLSTSAGTVSKVVWKAISATTIFLDSLINQ